MKPLIIVPLLLIITACHNHDKGAGETLKNNSPITIDTNCINPWNKAYFELTTKNFDTVVLAVKSKLTSILGTAVFDDNQFSIMQDSIKKAVFNTESGYKTGEIQIDTTNLLTLKDQLAYYLSDKITPRENAGWKNILTQQDQFTYQETSGTEIGYTILPCIKKIIRQEGKFKRIRKGSSLPEYSKNSPSLTDEINIYDCILNISIHLDVYQSSTFNNPKKQYYEVLIKDTAKVFTTINLLPE